MRWRSSASPSRRFIAAASAGTSPGAMSRPFSPSRTASGMPPARLAMIGTCAAEACSRRRPAPLHVGRMHQQVEATQNCRQVIDEAHQATLSDSPLVEDGQP